MERSEDCTGTYEERRGNVGERTRSDQGNEQETHGNSMKEHHEGTIIEVYSDKESAKGM